MTVPEPSYKRRSGPGASRRRQRDTDTRKVADLIVSSLRDGIIFLDNKGLVSRVNPAMEELLGISEEEAVGRSMKEITGDPEICLLITLKKGRTKDTFRHKGREFQVEAVEVFDGRGERAGTVTLFHDVTEIKKLERQRSEIMSMITHDLKAPLTAIIGHADLIMEGSLGEVGQEVRDSVEAMSRGGSKVLSIIDDYLTISKLEAGLVEPSFTGARIPEAVREAVSCISPAAGQLGRRISIELDPDLPEVECDPAQIERVISNLLHNAVKFSLKNGRIAVKASRAGCDRIEEITGSRPESDEAYIEICVRDEGIGIPDSELPYLFDRYWRGGGSGQVKGTGLGLAIVKSIVAVHNGFVGVRSAVGKGSSFYVFLPVVQPQP